MLKVGINAGPILSRLWTKVYEILGQCKGPLVLSNIVARLSSGKVWLSSVCCYPSAKPGSEVECSIYGGWVKTPVQF